MKELTQLQLKKYLERIGLYDYKPTLSRKTLFDLHEHHTFNIPFDGLSTHIGEKVKIDLDSIYTKLVLDKRKRGGYCYEMNTLFYFVLKQIGFNVSLHIAEVASPEYELGKRPARHQILLVTLENTRYLIDVGFGGNGLIYPIALGKKNYFPTKNRNI